MNKTLSNPTPKDPASALRRLVMLESAQARRDDAMFLASEVDGMLIDARKTVVADSDLIITGRMLAARLRQAAVWEYLDCEISLIAHCVRAFLHL